MATRKKATPAQTEFDQRLIDVIGLEELRSLKNRGYVFVYLYETNGLALDQWTQAYFAFREHDEEEQAHNMRQAVIQGRARKEIKVRL